MAESLRKGILAIDVGSGTQDILVWQPEKSMENCPKLILPSATTILGKLISQATLKGENLFLYGKTMGGGASSTAIKNHIKAGLKVFALPEAALTFHDNLVNVGKMGIEVVEERPQISPLTELKTGDIDIPAIKQALSVFYVALPEMVAVAVQDHGFSPKESNRAFRFKQWTQLLRSGNLESLLYPEPPDYLSRMKAVSEIVPGAWLMDTGAAAILGALCDPWVTERAKNGLTIVNAGNEHTVAALIKGEKIWGIYEHHTGLLTPSKLKNHLDRFRREALSNEEVFDEMGHGCRVLEGAKDASDFRPLSLTGPNRERFSFIGAHLAAPYGDMMLTGCFGLLEAVRKKLSKSPSTLRLGN